MHTTFQQLPGFRGLPGAKEPELMVALSPTLIQRHGSRAVLWSVVAFALGAVITTAVMWGHRLPLAGEGSVGEIAAWVAAACAAVAGTLATVLENRSGRPAWRKHLPIAKRILDLPVLAIALGMLSLLIVIAVTQLFQMGFRGLTIDPLAGGAMAGAAAAALTYVATRFGSAITTESLATLATLVIFMGTMAAMLSAPDETWWQLHFSQLGNAAGISATRFNLALIVTGLVLTVLANYIGNDIAHGLTARGAYSAKRVSLFSWLFAGIGVCLAMAGVFPDAVNLALHVGSASGMVVLFAVFVYLSLRLLPGLPREIAGFSLIAVIGIVFAIVLWIPLGYYNLTGMEFVAAGLLFAWLTVFARGISTYARFGHENGPNSYELS